MKNIIQQYSFIKSKKLIIKQLELSLLFIEDTIGMVIVQNWEQIEKQLLGKRKRIEENVLSVGNINYEIIIGGMISAIFSSKFSLVLFSILILTNICISHIIQCNDKVLRRFYE